MTASTPSTAERSITNAYRAHNSWPHFTVDMVRRRRVQHVTLAAPSRALKNTSAPGETNRDRWVWQIEIVGFSARSPHDTDDDLGWFGREVLAPLAAATGTPLVAPRPFYGPDCGWTLASPSARQRFTAAEWDAVEGVVAHQHAPENSHWDVGAFRIEVALAAASTTTNHMEDDMTPEDRQLLQSARDEAAAAGLRAQELESKVDRLLAWATRIEARLAGKAS